jgi:hypothetical protein
MRYETRSAKCAQEVSKSGFTEVNIWPVVLLITFAAPFAARLLRALPGGKRGREIHLCPPGSAG